MHQLGGITPPPSWCKTPLSGVTPLRNKLKRGTCPAGHTAHPDWGVRGRQQSLARHPSRTRSLYCWKGTGGVAWTASPGCGTRGRRQGLAGLRYRSIRAVRLACGDLAGGPPPTGAPSSPAHGHTKQPDPRAHQAARPHSRIRRRPEHQPDPTDTRQIHTPDTTESGPEPLGSGPPSMLSDYWRHAAGGATRQVITSAPQQSAVSSARPPCRPCQSSRR